MGKSKAIEIKIDDRQVKVPSDGTILDGAVKLGIAIPTLCHRDGCERYTSCMVCMVKNNSTGKLIPACSTPVFPGMDLSSDIAEVSEARRNALELLLSEHLGDCEAPCRQICPAFLNIPKIIRLVVEGELTEAIAVVREQLALPGVVSRVCGAPCEKGCRRGRKDQGVSIRNLVRYVADADLAEGLHISETKPSSGKKVAIIGAGPTGLSAAYYLVQKGHLCTVVDRNDKAGGGLQYGVSREDLSAEVLEAEIKLIRDLGVEFRLSTEITGSEGLKKLQKDYDAVVVAIGQSESDFGLKKTDSNCLEVHADNFETSIKRVFAGGDAILDSRQTVRAVADGRSIAVNIDELFFGEKLCETRPFNCRFGKLLDGDMEEFMKDAEEGERVEPAEGGFTVDEAKRESRRCLHCDCRKPEACKLRQHATEYEAKQSRFKAAERTRFEKCVDHETIVYEPGKCIKCGLCVRICAKAGEELGLAFFGRGFFTHIAVPFDNSLSRGVTASVNDCVEACPTGALGFKQS